MERILRLYLLSNEGTIDLSVYIGARAAQEPEKKKLNQIYKSIKVKKLKREEEEEKNEERKWQDG